MHITIYTKENCQPCKASKRLLTKEGLTFQEEPITEANRDLIKAMGFTAAPIIIVRDEEGNIVSKWSEFQPDLIKAIATK